MSGRAGRRGIDEKGMTILMVDQKLEPEIAKNMLKGQSLPLNSNFKVGYNMLLNSLKMEDTDAEYIIRKSFFQFQNQQKLPEKRTKLKELKNEIQEIEFENESSYRKLFKSRQLLKTLNKRIRDIFLIPKNILPYLKVGRLVFVKSKGHTWGHGIVINFLRKNQRRQQRSNKKRNNVVYIVDVMLYVKSDRKKF